MTTKSKNLSTILAPVSLGKQINKLTILQIKKGHMTGIKLKSIDKELELLKYILQDENLELDEVLLGFSESAESKHSLAQ